MEDLELRSRDLEDVPILGYADRYEELLGNDSDPIRIAEALEAQAQAAGLPMPGGRGLPAAFQLVVDFLRRRRFVEDLGVHTVQVPWLALHAPPGGSGALKWKVTETGESSFTLSVFGCGYGRGRKVSWSLESNVPARQTCLRFVQYLDLHIRLYALTSEDGERLEPTADVVASRGRAPVPWPDCPFCSVGIDAVDEFVFARGDVLDLTAYDSLYIETYSRELTGEISWSIAPSIPALGGLLEGGKIGLTAKQSAAVACTAVYEFAPGRCYQPYWPADEPPRLPYWSFR